MSEEQRNGTRCARFQTTLGWNGVRGPRRQRRVARLVAVASAVAVFSLTASPALASYHGIGFGYNSSGNHGGSASLCVTKLWIYDPVNDHVNNTIWMLVDPHDINYWTEAGMVNGDDAVTQPTFYWADNNTQYGYNAHFANFGPTLGSHYFAYIKLRSQPWWNVYIDGWTTGAGSWHNTSTAYGLQTGVEFTNPSTSYTNESGASQSTSYYDTSGNSHLGWVPGNSPEQDPPSQAFWYHQYTYFSEEIGQPWSC